MIDNSSDHLEQQQQDEYTTSETAKLRMSPKAEPIKSKSLLYCLELGTKQPKYRLKMEDGDHFDDVFEELEDLYEISDETNVTLILQSPDLQAIEMRMTVGDYVKQWPQGQVFFKAVESPDETIFTTVTGNNTAATPYNMMMIIIKPY